MINATLQKFSQLDLLLFRSPMIGTFNAPKNTFLFLRSFEVVFTFQRVSHWKLFEGWVGKVEYLSYSSFEKSSTLPSALHLLKDELGEKRLRAHVDVFSTWTASLYHFFFRILLTKYPYYHIYSIIKDKLSFCFSFVKLKI